MGKANPTDSERERLGLPRHVFMYTVDQIGAMIEMTPADVMKKVLWLSDREIGTQPRNALRAINVAKGTEKPEWRIEENEFIRWARYRNFRRYERFT